ncbi:hypothetical protein CLV57_1775 [Mucilaginibacter auburnensis]|uniref:Uncharacterized protein n=1 Tax=Mucilaginibacter auburnensis TaxID=1457233 RepID=A0A2H9VVA1_9SPHI|nr:hypothetical protein CLV57_1775 [Mucilaginibacter auburnensis]
MQFSDKDYYPETPQSVKILNWAVGLLLFIDLLWMIL